MSFASELKSLPVCELVRRSGSASRTDAQRSIAAQERTLADFAHLISPSAAEELPALSQRSQQLTRQRFGKVIRLFAPLYLSNECINNCNIAGFPAITRSCA